MEATRNGLFSRELALTPETVAGLYVHIPAVQNHHHFDRSALVAAISQEIEHHSLHSREEPITTVYVGGRPSLLAAESIRTLARSLRNELDGDPIEEVTVEVRPANASSRSLKTLRQLGATRLSIEGLSFVDEDLTAVGASHSADEVVGAIERSREMGFRSVSVDLHFGAPGQSLSNWKASLQRTVELRVPHVALHELDPDDDRTDAEEERAECLAFAMTFLKAKGYEQYELTHFARLSHRSHHQENYYAHGNYLGLGPGAESFWWPDRSANTTARRWSNVEDPTAYVEQLIQGESPVAHRETLDRSALAREYVLLRLRTNDGLNLDVLETRYGVDLRSRKSSALHRLTEEGLIHDDPDRVRLTDRGRLLTDAITQRLLP